MSGFNFGQIGDILSQFMDTDLIDIKRDTSGSLVEVYSNVKCHLSIKSTDNPDPQSVDVKPMIHSLEVHMPLWVDIQNNDYIVGKKIGSDGQILGVYSGRCGNPLIEQSRKKVSMQMSALDEDEPTPVPPQNPSVISIFYKSDIGDVQKPITIEFEVGKPFSMNAPKIDGYDAVFCVIDGVKQDTTYANIVSVTQQGHTIEFYYESVKEADTFRFLVNGLYTEDDGNLVTGYHLYKALPIKVIDNQNDEYELRCENYNIYHADSNVLLKIEVGQKIVLFPKKIYLEVKSINTYVNNDVIFIAKKYQPSQEELNAYVTGWYD